MPKQQRETTPAEAAELERMHLAFLDEEHDQEIRRHERAMRHLGYRREQALRRLARAEWLGLEPE